MPPRKAKVVNNVQPAQKVAVNNVKPDKKGKNQSSKVDKVDPKKVENNKPTKKVKVDESVSEEVIEKKLIKGKAAVDTEMANSTAYRVFESQGVVYDATLNQSNVNHNNNKFYKCQINQLESNGSLVLFTRWGRVGVKGQQSIDPKCSKEQAIQAYNSKLKSKQSGGYTLLDIKYNDTDEDEEQAAKVVKKKQIKTKLHPSQYDLMSLIFDQNLIDQAMKEIGYDARKMPLGKLGDSTINEAYQTLNDLLQEINKKNSSTTIINDLNNRFYSLIPHNFGFSQMSSFILKTADQVKDKLTMLQSLADMKMTTNIIKQSNQQEINEFDDKYKKLNCDLQPINKDNEQYKIVEKFITATQKNEKIVQIFKVDRKGESKKFKKDLGNVQLLWHGSRVQNFGGILSQGLRIAPPEAPHNGYAYGKGIYLANHYTTSQGYSQPVNGERLILLCRSALGNVGQFQGHQKYLKDGYQSAIGFASQTLPDSVYDSYNGMKIPCNPNQYGNAYIVYNLDQIQLEYLIRMKC